MSTNVWKPVTEFTPKPSTNPLDYPMDYTFTPQEKDKAAIIRLDIERMRRAEKASFTPGLLVKEVPESELTPAERVAFGLEA